MGWEAISALHLERPPCDQMYTVQSWRESASAFSHLSHPCRGCHAFYFFPNTTSRHGSPLPAVIRVGSLRIYPNYRRMDFSYRRSSDSSWSSRVKPCCSIYRAASPRHLPKNPSGARIRNLVPSFVSPYLITVGEDTDIYGDIYGYTGLKVSPLHVRPPRWRRMCRGSLRLQHLRSNFVRTWLFHSYVNRKIPRHCDYSALQADCWVCHMPWTGLRSSARYSLHRTDLSSVKRTPLLDFSFPTVSFLSVGWSARNFCLHSQNRIRAVAELFPLSSLTL